MRKFSGSLVILSLAAGIALAADTVPLKTELPKPLFVGTPVPINGTLDLITDGDKAGDEGSYVELKPGKQWVQIDLGEEANIYALFLWHFHSQERVYFDVVAQVSDDPTFAKGVTTVYNNDGGNELGLGAGKDLDYIESYQGKLIDAKGVKGRYVRLYSKGNTTDKLNHYIEVEVWGKPAQ